MTMQDVPLEHVSTSRLIVQTGAGSRTAFAALYDRCAPAVFGMAVACLDSRATAEWATEAAFLGVWRRSPQFSESRNDPAHWLLVLVDEGIDAARRRSFAGGTAPAPVEAADEHRLLPVPVDR